MVGKKFCNVCRKRRGLFPLTVKIGREQEKDIVVCKFCCQKYMKIREKYLIKAYAELLESVQKVNKND